MKRAIIRFNGKNIRVHATLDNPACSYGRPVWADEEGNAYLQVGLEFRQPFYELYGVTGFGVEGSDRNHFIVARCDPYHARFHYNGQKVLKYDGATPVEWIQDDDFGDGYTIEKAKEAIWKLALDSCDDNWNHENDDSIADFKAQILEDHGEDVEMDWYKGEGVYENNYPVILKGETSFQDDVMSYSVESMGDYDEDEAEIEDDGEEQDDYID